ncbi:MAG TPA: cupin domain-containing protein [Rhodospirillales bacterium]|nr:cupin domain-containing protein [Rhodospirillales bacterium]|tara:strand:- start:168 stop:752 length:585 start_codon:yes stop_codon:yes gene_type:complete
MKTITVTREEMESRVARFSQITPQSNSYSEEDGIPKEAYEMLTAKTLYLLMSPECQGGPMSHQPAVVTKDKMSVIIAKCPPGDRPLLHAHHRTNETFFCLDGRFRIRWGDEGENQTFLEQYDMIAVPPGVVRDFTNVSDKTARLLVWITGETEDDFNDIEMPPIEAQRLEKKFGNEVLKKFKNIGVSFNAGVDA